MVLPLNRVAGLVVLEALAAVVLEALAYTAQTQRLTQAPVVVALGTQLPD